MNKLVLFTLLSFLTSCLISKRERLNCDFCKPVNYSNSILYKQVMFELIKSRDSMNLRNYYFSDCMYLNLNFSAKLQTSELGYAFVQVQSDSNVNNSVDVLEIGIIDTLSWNKKEIFNEQMQKFDNMKMKKLAIQLIRQIKENLIYKIKNKEIIVDSRYKIQNIIWFANSK